MTKQIELPALSEDEAWEIARRNSGEQYHEIARGVVLHMNKAQVAATVRAAIAKHEEGRAVGEPVAWCELTPAGTISYFDGKPMIMCGPVGNEHHPHALCLASPPAPQEAQAGMVLVPREPTPKMLAALWEHRESFRGQSENKIARAAYSAMLAAAPVAQPATEQAEAPSDVPHPTGERTGPNRLIVLHQFLQSLMDAGDLEAEDQAVVYDGMETLARLVVERTATQPTASNAGERELSTPQAFQTLKAAIHADEGYAWSWHCVAWSCAFDEGLETGAANRAAARFMSMAFDIDTSKHPHFKPEHQRAALASKPVAPPAREALQVAAQYTALMDRRDAATIEAALSATPPAQAVQDSDAENYRLIRRGQHWSVIDGIGNTLRGEDLDAAVGAIRAARARGEGGASHG